MNYHEKQEINKKIEQEVSKQINEYHKKSMTNKYNLPNIILSVITICSTGFLGMKANEISKETANISDHSNEIIEKQMPLIYDFVNSKEGIDYNFKYNNKNYTVRSYKPAIKILQGSLSKAYGIVCHKKEIFNVVEMDKSMLKQMSTPLGMVLSWGDNLTEFDENGEAFDYSIVLLEDNAGNKQVILTYVKITYENGEFICDEPKKLMK